MKKFLLINFMFLFVVLPVFSDIIPEVKFLDFLLGSVEATQKIWGGRINSATFNDNNEITIEIMNTGSGYEKYILSVIIYSKLTEYPNNPQSEIDIFSENEFNIWDIQAHFYREYLITDDKEKAKKGSYVFVTNKLYEAKHYAAKLKERGGEVYICLVLKTAGFPYSAMDFKILKE